MLFFQILMRFLSLLPSCTTDSLPDSIGMNVSDGQQDMIDDHAQMSAGAIMSEIGRENQNTKLFLFPQRNPISHFRKRFLIYYSGMITQSMYS